MDEPEINENDEREIDLTATIDEDDLLDDPIVAVDDVEVIEAEIPLEDEEEEEEFLYPPGEEPEEL